METERATLWGMCALREGALGFEREEGREREGGNVRTEGGRIMI
jgi:hypothetical protein